MAYKKVKEESLVAVADAIRERAGTTEPLSFPEGMAAAVMKIPDHKETLRAVLDRSITVFESNEITELGIGAFAMCRSLESLTLPNLTAGAGTMCQNCIALTDIYLPLMSTAGNNAFQGIAATVLDFPSVNFVYANFVKSAPNLVVFILRNRKRVAPLSSINAFEGTPIATGAGYVYVPKTLDDGTDGVAAYQTATNWSTYADQIRAIEDYPEITGGATA